MKSASTPMEIHKPLKKDKNGANVDVHLYRSMIGSLMYLTSSRTYIMFAVCECSRFQVQPKDSHMHAVNDYAGARLDRKSTTGGCQFLGCRLVSWQYKKQNIMANSTTEAKYIAASNCCTQMANLKYCDKHNMVDFLKKPTESEGFTEIVDFLKGSSLRTLANGNQQIIASIDNKEYIVLEASVRSKLQLEDVTGINNLSDAKIYEGLGTLRGYAGDYVPLLPAMLVGAAPRQDEATTIGVEVNTMGATTITSGLDAGLDSSNLNESLLRSHETPLQEGYPSRSVEDSVKLQELMKVKTLEVALKRKTKRVIVSESEDEETEDQGRKIQDIDDDLLVSLVKDFMTPTKIKISALGEEQVKDISPITLEPARTLSKVASQKTKLVDKGRRHKRRKVFKGKDINTSLDFEAEVSTGFKDISTGFNDDQDVNIGFDGVNTGSIGVSTGSEPVSTPTQHYTEEDWDVIRAKLEANMELTKSVLGKDLAEEDFAKKMVDLVNQRKKYFGTWKLTQLKRLSFKEIKEEFDKLVKQIKTFVPISFEATKANLKRFGEELQTRTAKKLKIDDKDAQLTEEKVAEAKEEEPTKKIRKRRKQIARKGLHIEKIDKDETEKDKASEKDDPTSCTNVSINPVPVAVKPPSIENYKIIKQGKKGVY
ncbi:hypothetical protein Tco_0520007 [Tanacetum coccineum]